jgi:CRISPR system Cascade subunit CasA
MSDGGYDLRWESWIPWRRRDGTVEWAPPALLLELDNPVVGTAAPRPDFDGALHEFLIGLLATCFLPEDLGAWEDLAATPPTREAFEAELRKLPDAFRLLGDGPRFMQDGSLPAGATMKTVGISGLLGDSPGEDPVKENRDLFVKRSEEARFSRPAAAMAILALQTYAGRGGRGYYSSLRGEGAITTLVEPRVTAGGEFDASAPLWRMLWANVETAADIAARSPGGWTSAAPFPWLDPSLTVTGGERTTKGANPLEVYFAMPRRVWLVEAEGGVCTLTGRQDEQTAVSILTANKGIKYTGWKHPLSPYVARKNGGIRPKPGPRGAMAWRDWVGIALEEQGSKTFWPAQAVTSFNARVPRGTRARLQVLGYAADANGRPVDWVSEHTRLLVADPPRRHTLYAAAAAMVTAADLVKSSLAAEVRYTLLPVTGDGGSGKMSEDLKKKIARVTEAVAPEFFAATEARFYQAMATIAAADDDAVTDVVDAELLSFAGALRTTALEIYDRWCPAAGLPASAIRRRVKGRYALHSTVSGRSPKGKQAFAALGLSHSKEA